MSLIKQYRTLSLLVGGLLLAILGLAAYIVALSLQMDAPPQTASGGVAFVQESDFDGITPIEPPRAMPDFSLTNQDGESVNLYDLQGKPVMLTFGFTNCPDVCPLTMSEFRDVHEALGTAATDLHFVFISVDGTRDTPQALRQFFSAQRVDDFMLGLTGAEAAIRQLGVDYGLEFLYREPNASGWYNVDHTAGSFLLDANSNWVRRYAYGTQPDLIAADLRGLLGA